MKKMFVCIIIAAMTSCNSQSLDLSTIEFDKSSVSYHLEELKTYRKEEQKGHYEVQHSNGTVSLILKDDGERVSNYIFMEKQNTEKLNYAGIMIDPNIGASLSVYEDKIAYINMTVDHKSKFKMFDLLKNKLGSPTEFINRGRSLSMLDSEIKKEILLKFPEIAKIDEENGKLSFPEIIIWVKDNLFYQFTLNPVGNSVESSLVIISKKALKDRIIVGYHNPEKDPILSKYLN
jgi:hypothetical protein